MQTLSQGPSSARAGSHDGSAAGRSAAECDELRAAIADAPRADALRATVLALPGVAVTARRGSAAAAGAVRAGLLARSDIRRISQALLADPREELRLHLYDDLAELRLVVRNAELRGLTSGFDVHVVHDDDAARVHELSHFVEFWWIPPGGRLPGPAAREGLAHAMSEFVGGHHVHAWAGDARRRGTLPRIAALMQAPAGSPVCGGADVLAGSLIRYILDACGPRPLREFYFGRSPEQAFDTSAAELQRRWWSALETFPVTSEATAAIERAATGADLDSEREERRASLVPPAVRGRAGEWRSVRDALDPATGRMTLPIPEHAAYVLRIVAEPLAVESLVAALGAATLALGAGAPDAGPANLVRSEPGFSVCGEGPADLVLANCGGAVAVWVDGLLVARGAVTGARGPVTLDFGSCGDLVLDVQLRRTGA